VLILLLGILTLIGLPFGITLWDWAKLLIVPGVLAGGGIWFNRRQQERSEQNAERQAQDSALEAYLDDMRELLVDEKRPLHKAQQGDIVSTVARARTLTALIKLDRVRKATVLRFLYESRLIVKHHPVLDLSGADLKGANLTAAGLHGAALHGAQLQGANLSITYVDPDTNMLHFTADLIAADLSSADLTRADLSSADLGRTNLSGTNLSGAVLDDADLSSANLNSANLGKPSKADLSGADHDYLGIIWAASLRRANLQDADLRGANLAETDLHDANLSGANMSGAHLVGGGWSNTENDIEFLEREAASLKGAIMPDGQKYEDWLKSKGRGEDGENSGPS